MPRWTERLRNDEHAIDHADEFKALLTEEFRCLEIPPLTGMTAGIITEALFEYIDDAIEYSQPGPIRLHVIFDLDRLVAALSERGRLKKGEMLSAEATDLLLGVTLSGNSLETVSFQQDLEGNLISTSPEAGASYSITRATIFLPQDSFAARARSDRFAAPETDDRRITGDIGPDELPFHIRGIITACRRADDGRLPLALLRERLTSSELRLLRMVARRTAKISEYAFGIEDRNTRNQGTHTLTDYKRPPPAASFGFKLLKVAFPLDGSRRILATEQGRMGWDRLKRTVQFLADGVNVVSQIRKPHSELDNLNLLIGYAEAHLKSVYARKDVLHGEDAEEDAEIARHDVARKIFREMLCKYESVFVLKFVNKFLDYYDLNLQRFDRTPVMEAYTLFFSKTLYRLRRWERELETQVLQGVLLPTDVFPKVDGQAVTMFPVPKDILLRPMRLCTWAGQDVFAKPDAEIVRSLIDVLFSEHTADRTACQDSWEQLVNFLPPENLEVRAARSP
jgi:hypothetical protein